MNTIRTIALLAACSFAGAACAQNANKPLNLQLPPSDMPVAASTAAHPATSHPATDRHGNPTSAPGVYYGDHSGPAIPASDARVAAQRCDDSTYNQPQMHGSASMGVMGGNHVSGSYQAATINVTKNLGDCEHPAGGVGLSIHVGQGQYHGRHW